MANTGLNRLYLAENISYSMDCYETKRNLNTLVIGASGCGKTRSIVTPNLLGCSGSYVISDPKGNLYGKYGNFLRQNGYKVRLVDLIHLDRGEGFNFMEGLVSEEDIMSAAVVFQQSHSDNSRSRADPFWDHSEIQALSGAIGCILEMNKLLEDIVVDSSTLSAFLKVLKREVLDGIYVPDRCKDRCMSIIDANREKQEARVNIIFVNGKPGSGKTGVALGLLSEYLQRDEKKEETPIIRYATGKTIIGSERPFLITVRGESGDTFLFLSISSASLIATLSADHIRCASSMTTLSAFLLGL